MAILSKAIKALDPTPDKKTELTLALSLLSELSESKVRDFQSEVEQSYRTAGTPENRTAPITMIVASISDYRAYIKTDNSKIPGEVGSAIKDFVSGGSDDIIKGVAKLVTTGLDALLGKSEGSQQEMKSYYITVQSRALVRYDILAWKRSIEASGITKEIESCLAFYASKASIDVSALDLNTFLIAYEDQLNKMDFTDKETKEYLDYAEEIYNKLRGDSDKANSSSELDFVSPNSLNVVRPTRAGHIVFTSK